MGGGIDDIGSFVVFGRVLCSDVGLLLGGLNK